MLRTRFDELSFQVKAPSDCDDPAQRTRRPYDSDIADIMKQDQRLNWHKVQSQINFAQKPSSVLLIIGLIIMTLFT